MVRLIEKYEGEILKEQYNIINKNSIICKDDNIDISIMKIIKEKIYHYFVTNRNWYSEVNSLMLSSENIKFIINRNYFKTSTHINRNKIFQNNIIKDDLFLIEHIYSELKRNKIKYIAFIDWTVNEPLKNLFMKSNRVPFI